MEFDVGPPHVYERQAYKSRAVNPAPVNSSSTSMAVVSRTRIYSTWSVRALTESWSLCNAVVWTVVYKFIMIIHFTGKMPSFFPDIRLLNIGNIGNAPNCLRLTENPKWQTSYKKRHPTSKMWVLGKIIPKYSILLIIESYVNYKMIELIAWLGVHARLACPVIWIQVGVVACIWVIFHRVGTPVVIQSVLEGVNHWADTTSLGWLFHTSTTEFVKKFLYLRVL